ALIATNLNLTAPATRTDLVLPNQPPIISVSAVSNRRSIAFAAPGSNVELQTTVSALKNDSLTYIWQAANGPASGVKSINSPNLPLTLPLSNCPVRINVLVGDGYGGY